MAYKQKKAAEKKEEQRLRLAEKIPEERQYITIKDAVVLFGISKPTLYRLIRKGKIPAVNLGERLTRISRAHIEAMFPKVETAKAIQPIITKQEINFDPANCYTVGEISQKFGISLSTVDKTIRKNSIPKRQIGKYVYVPKSEIDKLFK
jgi:excisionase family DNA binding protein